LPEYGSLRKWLKSTGEEVWNETMRVEIKVIFTTKTIEICIFKLKYIYIKIKVK